jgi:hypothetical protein
VLQPAYAARLDHALKATRAVHKPGEIVRAEIVLIRISRFDIGALQHLEFAAIGALLSRPSGDERLVHCLGLRAQELDRIVVGEVRDGAAALETLKAWNTGHPGGLCTLHANTAEEALRRLEDLILEVASEPPRRSIGAAVDLIVHMARTQAGRRVEGLVAVAGNEDGQYLSRDL